jgi:prepilin signal peptidase PulO-like enzyme (type II secretory pathway)
VLAIIVQALCILPQFFINLYKQEEYRLLFSMSAFVVIATLYWILSNTVTLHLYVVLALIIALVFFAIDAISRLKKTVNEQGFVAIPFGPALLFAAFMILFYGQQIVSFLKKYIFMVLG